MASVLGHKFSYVIAGREEGDINIDIDIDHTRDTLITPAQHYGHGVGRECRRGGPADLRSQLMDPAWCVALATDVSSGPQVARGFVRAAEPGGYEVLVNAAGIGLSTTLFDHDEHDRDPDMDTKVGGSFPCLREAVSQMNSKGGGTIGDVASVAGLFPSRQPEVAYDPSKGAVVQMTRSATRELAPGGVRVNSVAPGPVPTNLYGTPPGRPKEPMPLGDGWSMMWSRRSYSWLRNGPGGSPARYWSSTAGGS